MLFSLRNSAYRSPTPSSAGLRKRLSNFFTVCGLLPLASLFIGHGTLQAATITADASLSGVRNWTAGSTWIGGNVPGPNDRAIIPEGSTVLLNGTNHIVRELIVQGTLRAAETPGVNRTLRSNWIHVNGRDEPNSGGLLQIGSATNRYDQANFTIILTGEDPNQDFDIEVSGCGCGCMGSMTITNNDSFLMACNGGRLQFFGEDKLSFTKLAATANSNSSQIIVENVIERNFDGTTSAASDGALNWEVGDQIVIASSSEDYDDEEVRTITSIANLGNGTSRISLNSRLNRRHYGQIETYSNNTRDWDLDLRAEVALLSRNVRVEGEAFHDTDNNFGDRARFTQSLGNTGDGFGGHIMIMETAGQTTIDGVQLDRLGQTGRLGRYPIHWHLAGDRSGDILRRTSITNSNNRGVTIHGTDNVLIEGVVLHDIHGHGFFMEDGVETGNEFIANIAFGIHKVGRSSAVGDFAPDVNDPFIVDTHDHVGQNPNRFLSSAGYWVTNPDNTWVGNISAGSEGTGFWFILPAEAIGTSASDPQYANVRPELTNLRQFDFNSSHSSPAGLNFDRGSDLEVPVGGNIKAFFDGDNWLPSSEPQINNFTAYKHNVAIYHRGFIGNFHDNRIADSDIGTFITFTQRITDTLYVGHSRGNADLSDSVTGHSIYDGANTLDGIHFGGFGSSNAHMFRTNGSALRHTSHVMSNTSFENDGSANHVSVADPNGNSAQNSPFDFSPTSVYDADGTLTGHVGGGPGWTVVANHPFFYDSDDIVPNGWNAAISPDLYAMLHFSPANSNSRFRVRAPDGDRITDEGTSRRNTHIKVGFGFDPADDHLIDLAGGSLSNAFDFFYYTRTGPTGPSVLRLAGFGNSLRPQDMNRATTVEQLRSANEATFTVVNGDVYIKAFSSSDSIRMRDFNSTNPIARNDQATVDEGTSVTIDVLANDNDNDGDSLTVSPGTSVVVADYSDDFQTSPGPASGWQYLWNETGAFGNANNYSVMPVSGGQYRPSSEPYLNLASGSGHPGSGLDQGGAFNVLTIAAYTVASDGNYSIANSFLTRDGTFGDGVGVMLHVGNTVTQIGAIAAEGSGNFDTSLGFLTAGTTVYIGVSPDGPGAGSSDGNDFFTWDFSIVRQEASQNGQLMVNSDQSITYTPDPGFVGSETISYEISDGRGGSDTANITVTTVAVEDEFLLGDVNQDGGVNFLDIAPFILLLQNGDFLEEADTNEDGGVNFLDIGPFISLLTG